MHNVWLWPVAEYYKLFPAPELTDKRSRSISCYRSEASHTDNLGNSHCRWKYGSNISPRVMKKNLTICKIPNKTYLENYSIFQCAADEREFDHAWWRHQMETFSTLLTICAGNYTNPGYGLSLVDTLWNAVSYRQPLEQKGNPIT